MIADMDTQRASIADTDNMCNLTRNAMFSNVRRGSKARDGGDGDIRSWRVAFGVTVVAMSATLALFGYHSREQRR